MKISSFLISIFLTIGLSAQSFTEYLPPAPFEKVANSATVFVDVDNDGDQDVIISGSDGRRSSTKLYLNSGIGTFTPSEHQPFQGTFGGSLAVADVDGDEDQDILITGTSNENKIATLYLNDGFGNFTVTATPFEPVSSSAIAFIDIDGDDDQDLLLTGARNENNRDRIAKLYMNDGNGSFTEIESFPFEGVYEGNIAFADVNGDGHQDVLICGVNKSGKSITKLYTNDGHGFEEVLDIPFEGVNAGTLHFSDVDNDGDEDVLITGSNEESEKIARLYINDGDGNFTEQFNTSFIPVSSSAVTFSDVDADGDEDVLIAGFTGVEGQYRITKLYLNDSLGNFTEASNIPFDHIDGGAIAFGDIDDDSDQDVLITGAGDFNYITSLYTNDGNGNFTLIAGLPFRGMHSGAVAFGDVDNDNDLDAFALGFDYSSSHFSSLSINDGLGNFEQQKTGIFENVSRGDVVLGDVDGDGDLDIILTGFKSFGSLPIAKLYLNNGNGNFIEVLDTPLEGVMESSAAFSDIDGDNDLDLLLTGLNEQEEKTAKLYINHGEGNFTEVLDTPFEGVMESAVAFSDVDEDGDQDILITGLGKEEDRIAKLYLNDGLGNFMELMDAPFKGVRAGSVAFSDIDTDGDQDVLITGFSDDIFSGEDDIPSTILYLNQEGRSFSRTQEDIFEPVGLSAVAFSDADLDGDQDVLITGESYSSEEIAKLYLNDGRGNFEEASDMPFLEVRASTVNFADIDGDGDEDVLITGIDTSFNRTANLYINTTLATSTEEVIANKKTTQPLIYPNPSKNGEVFIEYNSNSNKDIKISLFDLQGKLLFQKQASVNRGLNTLNSPYPPLPNGLYLLRIEDGIISHHTKLLIH